MPRPLMGLVLASATLAGAFQADARPRHHAPAPPRIVAVTGTYGGNCRRPVGNDTLALSQTCRGRDHCSYRIDTHRIGDPAFGCAKDYVARWTCSNCRTHVTRNPPEADNTSVFLAC